MTKFSREAAKAPNPPVNIMMSFDEKVIMKFVRTGVLEDDDSVLFSSEDAGFLSMTHSLRQNKTMSLNLEILDPAGSFLGKSLVSRVEDMEGKENGFAYIMYGIGADPNYWAGPFRLAVIGADYTISPRGKEIVNLSFIPNAVRLAEAQLRADSVTSDHQITNTRVRLMDFDLRRGLKIGLEGPRDQLGYKKLIHLGPDKWIEAVDKLLRNVASACGVDSLILLHHKNVLSLFDHTKYLPNIPGAPTGFVPYTLVSPILTEMQFMLRDIGFTITHEVEDDVQTFYLDLNGESKKNANIVEVLNRFNSVAKKRNKSSYKCTVIEETNTRLITLLRNHKKFGEFVNSGSVLISGSTGLIDKHVYGYEDAVAPAAMDYGDAQHVKKAFKLLREADQRENYYVGSDSLSEFGYTEEESTFVPYFSAGTPTSDILDYRFDFNNQVITFLTKRIDVSGDPNSYREFIRNRFEELVNESSANAEDARKVAKAFPDIDNHVDFVMDRIGVSGEPSDVFGSTTSEENAVLAYIDFLWNLGMNSYITGSITTIPRFGISNMRDIFKMCHIVIGDNPDPYRFSREDLRDFSVYTGAYTILGFEHTITPRRSSSTFEVLKEAVALTSKSLRNDKTKNEKDYKIKPSPGRLSRSGTANKIASKLVSFLNKDVEE